MMGKLGLVPELASVTSVTPPVTLPLPSAVKLPAMASSWPTGLDPPNPRSTKAYWPLSSFRGPGALMVATAGGLEITVAVPAGMAALQVMFDVKPTVALAGAVATPVLVTIVTSAVLDEAHKQELVMACIVPSLNVAEAVKLRLPPGGMLTADGLTAIELSTATTVKGAEPMMLPEVAMMLAVPLWTPVATPLLGSIVALAMFDELHVTAGVVAPVRAIVVPSLKVPVAVNGGVLASTLTDGTPPPTAIEVSAAAATVAVEAVVALTPDWLQVMFAVRPIPALLTAVAKPLLLMVTTAVFEDIQTHVAVMSFVLLSLKVPVAVNCCVPPRGILALEGLMAIDFKAAGEGVAVPPPPPQLASAAVNNNTQTARIAADLCTRSDFITAS